MLELMALILAGIHFGVPLIYYWYARSRWLHQPWKIEMVENYRPRITVVVPTYNEADFIQKKLDDLCAQDYPKDRMEIVIVDSASKDGTLELAEKWCQRTPSLNVRLLREDTRRGKLHALHLALKHTDPLSEVVVFTDADAYWERRSLSKVLSYFADQAVGSVTGCISYIGNRIGMCEGSYRKYYNELRVAESKIHATPVHNGPLLAIRAKLLQGDSLPNFPGSDDSAFGSFIAFMGYRSIQADNVMISEPMRGSQFRRKVRRAQHLLLSFMKTKRCAKNMKVYNRSAFDKIWMVEWWLHVGNPWILLASSVLLIFCVLFRGSQLAPVLLVSWLPLLAVRVCRMWVMQQSYLIMAMLKNLRTNEAVWSK